MIILGARTDKPVAELYIHDGDQVKDTWTWYAHRQLSDTIFTKLDELLNRSKLNINDIDGIAIYAGPGSFTGLRIGHSFANTLSYAQNVPVVATEGQAWLLDAVAKLQLVQGKQSVRPVYGGEARTTKPRK